MNNGSNKFGVGYDRIAWFENALAQHGNIRRCLRRDDIIFEIERHTGQKIIAICLDEYVLGFTVVNRVLTEYPDVNYIYIGGNWNKPSPEAAELCKSKHIGLYNASGITGSIWEEEFWNFIKKPKKRDSTLKRRRF